MKTKLIRISTVPIYLNVVLKGQLKFLKNFFDILAVSSPGENLDQLKQREKIKVVKIKMSRKITPILDLISLLRMILLFVKEKPLIIHSATPKAGIISMIAGWVVRVPIRLHTVAGLAFVNTKGLKKKILFNVEKITYAFSTQIYPNSKGTYDYIVKNNLANKNKLKIIGDGSSNGIHLKYFSPKKDINKDKFTFIFIGRLVASKGIEELIKAFIRVYKKFPIIELSLVGDFEEELDPIKRKISEKIYYHKHIKYHGYLEDVRDVLAASDVLILPSHREGFPNVLLQALAMGKPCLASNISGCNEIVINNENGLLIEPHSTKSLEIAMTNILDAKLYLELKKNTRDSIRKYDQATFWENLKKEYEFFVKNYD